MNGQLNRSVRWLFYQFSIDKLCLLHKPYHIHNHHHPAVAQYDFRRISIRAWCSTLCPALPRMPIVDRLQLYLYRNELTIIIIIGDAMVEWLKAGVNDGLGVLLSSPSSSTSLSWSSHERPRFGGKLMFDQFNFEFGPERIAHCVTIYRQLTVCDLAWTVSEFWYRTGTLCRCFMELCLVTFLRAFLTSSEFFKTSKDAKENI